MILEPRIIFLLLISISCYDCIDDILKPEQCELKEEQTTVTKKGCKEKNITIKYCSGRCMSFAHYKNTYPYFKTNCRCCRATEMRTRSTMVYCDEKTLEAILYDEAVKCECRKCDGEAIKR